MIKILFHDISSSGGGSTQSLRILYDHFDENLITGHFVFGDRNGEDNWKDVDTTYISNLVSYPNYDFAPKPLSPRGVYAFLNWFCSSIFGYYKCKRLLKTQKPDIIHLNSGGCTTMATAAKALGIPVVWHIRELHRDNFINRFWYQKKIRRCASHVICISKGVAQRLKSLEDIITIIPNPAPTYSLEELMKDRIIIRNNWGIKKDDFLVLLLGNFSINKGYLFLAKIANNVNNSSIIFVLGGQPFSKPACGFHLWLRKVYRLSIFKTWYPEKIVSFWKSSNSNVVFPGHISPNLALSAADLVVCPNICPEPFGRTVIEAFAAKKAVLVSDLPTFEETITHDHNGWRLPVDENIWSEFLNRIVKNPEEIIRISENCYKSRLKYEPRRIANTIQNIYKDIPKSRDQSY